MKDLALAVFVGAVVFVSVAVMWLVAIDVAPKLIRGG